MIDLHTHTLFSDGALIPSELIHRAEIKGYRAIAITDHADSSNIDFIIPRVVKVCNDLNKVNKKIKAIPGIEISHVPPKLIPSLVKEARELGAKLVLVHGETIVEPVEPGTNRTALESDIDILTHPGHITKEDALLAAKKGIYLELSTRKGHSLANGHVTKMARETGAKLILCTDAHHYTDLITKEEAIKVAKAAGLSEKEIKALFKNAQEIANRC